MEGQRQAALPKTAEDRLVSLEEEIKKKAAGWTDKIIEPKFVEELGK